MDLKKDTTTSSRSRRRPRHHESLVDTDTSVFSERENRPAKGSWTDFFFGFLYQEDGEDASFFADDDLYRSSMSATPLWNSLNLALFAQLLLSSAASTVPAACSSSSNSALSSINTHRGIHTSPSVAILGMALGKLLNGPVGDLLGARRTLVLYGWALAGSLLLLACSPSLFWANFAHASVEFVYSVQWPCVVICLASHHRGNAQGAYEGGIFVTSLGTRLGPVLAWSLVSSWSSFPRLALLVAAWLALVASSVSYFYVRDTPYERDSPQNPVDWEQFATTNSRNTSGSRNVQWRDNSILTTDMDGISAASTATGVSAQTSTSSTTTRTRACLAWIQRGRFIWQHNLGPSVRHILKSPTFWLVSWAHSGAALVRSSERYLARYLQETAGQEQQHTSATKTAVICVSLGSLLGLATAGHVFGTCRTDRERKTLVTRLYWMSILACYLLCFLSIFNPNAPNRDLIRIFQVMAMAAAGFGVAVQYTHIPSLVGATFGCDKGLFLAYADGVGFGLASWVWHIVDRTPWSVRWAAVALWLLVSAVVMVEFMEHYFCRKKNPGTVETIVFL